MLFNVLPGRSVSEALQISQFRVGEDWIEAEFERRSEMADDADFLQIESALVQIQKIIYVFCCSKFGFPTDPAGEESLKIWPTSVQVAMEEKISDDKGLVHRVRFEEFRKLEARKYFFRLYSMVGRQLSISGTAIVQLLKEPNKESG